MYLLKYLLSIFGGDLLLMHGKFYVLVLLFSYLTHFQTFVHANFLQANQG